MRTEEDILWTDLNRSSKRAALLKHLTKKSLFERCLLMDRSYLWGEEEFDRLVLRGGVHFPVTRKEIEERLGLEFKGELGVFKKILREESASEIELEFLLYNSATPLRGWGSARLDYASSNYLAIGYNHVCNGSLINIGWDKKLENQADMDVYDDIEQNQQKIDLLVREADKVLALAESALLAHREAERGR